MAVITYAMWQATLEDMDGFGIGPHGIPQAWSADGRVFPAPRHSIRLEANVLRSVTAEEAYRNWRQHAFYTPERTSQTEYMRDVWAHVLRVEPFPLQIPLRPGEQILEVKGLEEAGAAASWPNVGRVYRPGEMVAVETGADIRNMIMPLPTGYQTMAMQQQMAGLGAGQLGMQQTAGHGLLAMQAGLGLGQLGMQTNPDGEASARARALLLRLLDPDQRREYEAHGHFSVVRDGVRYRLSLVSMQVGVFREGQKIETWCAYVPNEPKEDTLVAQLLLLRDDPQKLRRLARVTKHDDPYIRPGGGIWTDIDPEDEARRRNVGMRAHVMRMLVRAGYANPEELLNAEQAE
jgi:hypothetical protein